MSEVFHLVYSSKATSEITRATLDNILKVSREKNEPNQITGLLLHRDGHFLQLLEGDEAEVQKTYDRIKRDPRHSDSVLLTEFHSETRLFESWSMGHIESPSENEKMARKLEYVLRKPFDYQDNMKSQVMEVFRTINRETLT